MKEHINRKKIDHEQYLQVLAQQRIDQATINHLNTKIQEMTEKFLSKSSLNDEIDKLHAKIDGYREKEKLWNQEKNELMEKLKKSEMMRSISETRLKEFSGSIEEAKSERELLEQLQQDKIMIKESIRLLNENGENQEIEIKNRIQKLKNSSEAIAEELKNMNKKHEEGTKKLESLYNEIN